MCIPPLQSYLLALKALHPNWRISIVALQYPFTDNPYAWHGLQVRPMGGANRGGFRKLFLWRKTIRACQEVHRQMPVDAVHSFWLREAALLGGRLARKWGRPHVSTLQGQDALPENKYLRRLNWSHVRVAAISERGKAQLKVSLAGKELPQIDVLPWGLADSDFSEKPSVERPIDVLGVGNLVQVKRYDVFLEAVAKLREKRPDLKAVLVGNGVDRAALEKQAAALGLAGMLEFRGQVPRKEVLELMAQSKVFLHTARYEGQGYVFLEALARGMHLVSTPVGMAREMDKWKLGADADALAVAVEDFLEKPVDWEQRILMKMRETVEGYVGIYTA